MCICVYYTFLYIRIYIYIYIYVCVYIGCSSCDPPLTSTKGRLRNVTDCKNITSDYRPTYIKLTCVYTHHCLYTHISLLIGFMHHQPSDGELDHIAQQLSSEKSLKCNTISGYKKCLTLMSRHYTGCYTAIQH